MSAIENLKVRTKILIGFGLLLTILTLVGGVGLAGLGQIRDANDIVTQRARVSAIAKDIELRFAAARRFVITFAYTGSPDAASQGDKALAATDAVIRDGLTEIKNPERLGKLREIAAATADYTKSFDRVKTLVRGADTLQRDVLNPTGVKLQHDFNDFAETRTLAGNSAAQLSVRAGVVKLLVARLDANQALAKYEDARSRQAEDSLGALNQALKAIEPSIQGTDAKPLFDDIGVLSATYTSAFHQILASNKEADALITGSMPEDAARVAEIAEAIKHSATDDQEQAEGVIREAIAFSRTISLVLMTVGLAAGVVLTLGPVRNQPLVLSG